ncbi:MAG: redoxin domain-containing protein [Deltaproteobacteria bacterium]|nr:redoxin domain-containing protein [Candidatus Latescibacterota bacterium]NIS77375.1 redoxin domain-containing protein [Deltaproteobacteria bacterium]
MKKFYKPIIIFSVLLAVALTAVADESGAKKKEEKLPEFSLKSLDGKETVTDLTIKGKPAVFVVMQTACSACRGEVNDLNAFYGREEYKNIQFYLVCVDVKPEASLPRYLKTYNVSIPALVDPEYTFGTKYSIPFSPATVFFDKDAKVAKIMKGYKAGSFEEMKEALDELK